VRLSNGAAIAFRPIRPEDAERLAHAFTQLSAQSRYRRFLAPVRSLSEEQLRAFTQVDHVDHVAWVAELSEHPDRPVVGVGRFIRLPEDRAVAEIALTVVDAFQGRGLGRMLLELLATSAIVRAVSHFHATVLVENQPMRSLLRSYGAKQVGFDVGAYKYRLPVRSVLQPIQASA
jgi:acetyltransferase